ncbi:MAG: alanine racemase, partial [Mesorhizobium sp.]
KQRHEFDRLRKMLPAAPASLANSSGIFLGPAYHYDLARPGAALYGVNPTPHEANPMLPVIRLEAKVAQTREIGAGTGIGYGHTHQADGPLRLATISLGYG